MKHQKLGEIAISSGWLTSEECEHLLELQLKIRQQGATNEASYFGLLLEQHGVCSKTVVERLLHQQKISAEFSFYSLKSGGDSFIFQDYQVEKFIAQGGMGNVYLATQDSKRYAIKIINWNNYHETFPKRFQREVDALKDIKHPGVVRLHEAGQFGEVDFIIMDYIEGEILQHAIQYQTFSWQTWLKKFCGLLSAVQAIHQKGIIHRDLKPANIILQKNGELILIDFGLSKKIVTEYSTLLTKEIIGTPEYMSPEQISNSDVDERSDIWSLGVTMYQSLTGKMPFEKSTNTWQHYSGYPKSMQQYNIPPNVERICFRALEIDKLNRYSSIHDMLKDIQDVLCGKPIYFSTVVDSQIQDNQLQEVRATPYGKLYKANEGKQKGSGSTQVLRIHPFLSQTPLFRRKFFDRKEAYKALSHNCLPRVTDMGEDQEGLYVRISAPCSNETSLKALLKKEKLSIAKTLDLALAILDVLDYFHRQSWHYGQLAPANIFILHDSSNTLSSLSIPWSFFSTPVEDSLYLSPEFFITNEKKLADDFYSLGVIIWECLSGQCLFEKIEDKFVSIDKQIPILDAIPKAFRILTTKALHSEADKRFLSVAEFRAALRLLQKN